MKKALCILFLCTGITSFAQNEFAKWYFGRYTGLDFMTSPPTVINHTTMNTFEGCASAADGAGNLLFYTDGATIWNKQQLVMANGTGLMGNGTTLQAALIAKQPGNSNIYFVFTLDAQGWANGLRYTIVDMNLAAGMGSVTIKNVAMTTPCTEQLTGARHCNGVDMWVISHDFNSNNFYSYLLTSAGVNLSPVVSSIGPAPPTFTPNNTKTGQGTLKASPSGRKLGLTFFNGSNNSEVALFDFDRSTGIISNYFSLMTGTVNCYGCEFSGDGTKFYAGAAAFPPAIYQWDLCAGSATQVVASKVNVITGTLNPGQLQLAPNGKIYVPVWNTQTLSVINNPDQPGIACGYVPFAMSVASGTNGAGLPNFFGGVYKNLPTFTYSINPLVSCATASFFAPSNPTVNLGCGASGYSVQSISWHFGQPFTGASNTSTLSNPIHNFGAAGTYPVKLVFHYSCGTDTVYKQIVIPGATVTITSNSISCSLPGTASVNISGGTGPFNYTWMPSAQSSSTASVNAGSYTISILDNGGGCLYSLPTFFSPPTALSGTINATSVLACYGASNGTANINLTPGTGGTGNYVYSWSNSQTTPTASGLSGGTHSVIVTDGNCVLTQTFQITQPPTLSLSVSSSSSQACAGTFITLQALAAGGTGTASYSWSGGPLTDTFVTTQSFSGTVVYSVNAADQNGCVSSNTIQVMFIPNPVLSVPAVSICPKQSATLTASGATSYSWSPSGTNGPVFSVTPTATQAYTITGSFSTGCTSTVTSGVTVLKCTGVNERGISNMDLRIYPNPSAGDFFVETVETLKVALFDFTGREIANQTLNPGTNAISTTKLKSGVYFLEVKGTNKYPAYKVIKLD